MKRNGRLEANDVLSGILAVLLLVTAVAGLFLHSTYRDWIRPQRIAESQGQDVVTLFVALPLLIWAAYRTRRGDPRGPLFWAGTLGYALYVYLIYAYGGLYNIFFPLYVAIIGLCIFTLIGLLRTIEANAILTRVQDSMPRGLIASYLLGTAALITAIWGSAIGTAIVTQTPDEATIVYVTDLAFVLPLFALSGLWLWQRRAWGYVLSGVMLVKAVTLGLSISIGQILAYGQGSGGDLFLAGFFGLFTVMGAIALRRYLKHFDGKPEEEAAQ